MTSFTPLSQRSQTFSGEKGAAWQQQMLKKSHSFHGRSEKKELLRRRIQGSNLRIQRTDSHDVGRAEASEPSAALSEKVVVIVDAFTTGACVAEEAQKRGYSIAHVTSLPLTAELGDMMPGHLKGGVLKFVSELAVDDRNPDPVAAADDVARTLGASLERAGFRGGLGAVVAVVPGAETGVRLCDHLQESVIRMQAGAQQQQAKGAASAARADETAGGATWTLRTNGSSGSEARREKYVMGEKVRAAGVRAVKQFRAIGEAAAFEPVQAFLSTHWPPVAKEGAEGAEGGGAGGAVENDDDGTPPGFLAVVKPVESAGSDGVTACRSFSEVHAAVKKLVGAVNGLGQVNEGVLVQEFLRGIEYVVDSCSSGGEHRVAAIWRYDRRAINGAGFVLLGQRLIAPEEPEVALLTTYAFSVLEALEFQHGPSHMEVKLCPKPGMPIGDGTLYDDSGADVTSLEPCLVEVGARCHGAEGFWMSVVEEAYYPHQCQTLLALDAYLPNPPSSSSSSSSSSALSSSVVAASFAAAPSPGPPPLVAHGRIKFLVLFEAGNLANPEPCLAQGLEEILAMPTYRAHEVFASPGAAVTPTIDCFSWGGVVKLCGSEEDVRRDYDRIDALCLKGLWNWA